MINSPKNRDLLIKAFPALANDDDFVIEDSSPNYNCIAWAANRSDCWWDKLPYDKRPFFRLDGVKFDWPYGAAPEFTTVVLVGIFNNLDYIICADGSYEEGFKKVVIYENQNGASHMARQLVGDKLGGLWTSKLGSSFRIIHKNPQTIEGKAYGLAKVYMKKSMS